MKNATKDKGDVGVARVIADLVKHGFKIALPMSDHLPFDLIAISESGRMSRFSIKHRHINARGCIEASTRSVYSNSRGHHCRYADKNWIDGIAIFCPDSACVYYIPIYDLGSKRSINLRLTSLSNAKALQQQSKIKRAVDYIDLKKWR